MLKYSDSTPLIYQENIRNSTIKLSLEAECTTLAARNNQDPLDSLLWDAEILHQTWLLLSFQKAFSNIKEGIGVGFALHWCQPNVWSDWSPTCFTLFTLGKFPGFKKNKNCTKLWHKASTFLANSHTKSSCWTDWNLEAQIALKYSVSSGLLNFHFLAIWKGKNEIKHQPGGFQNAKTDYLGNCQTLLL